MGDGSALKRYAKREAAAGKIGEIDSSVNADRLEESTRVNTSGELRG